MLPILEAALPTLLPLLKKRDTYYLLAIALLAFLFWSEKAEATADAAALAARAHVTTHAEVVTKTVRIAGKVHYDVKTVYVPGTNQVQYVERVVTRDPVTTTIEADRKLDQEVAPACSAAPDPWRYAGVLADPTAPTKLVGLRGGVTVWKRLDLGLGFRFSPHLEGQFEAGVRF